MLAMTISSLIMPQPARAASGAFNYGEVITVQSCPQVFVVAEGDSFSIIETVGGPQVLNMDVLAGDLERIGLTTVLNTSRNNQPLKVIVLDSLLTRTQFSPHLARYCHR